MDKGVRTTSSLIEEFVKSAHEAIDVLRERAVALEGNMEKVMAEGNKALSAMNLGEGTKLGKYVENNPTKAALYSFMTTVMFTHFMKARGLTASVDAPGVKKTEETSKSKGTKAA